MKRLALILTIVIAVNAFAGDGENEFKLGKATLRAGNRGRAREYFEQAANQGHGEAANLLGVIYAKGDGVPADFTAAAEWFRKGAERGHAGAMNNYASLLRTGRGVAKNDVDATNWYRKSAESGDAIGTYWYADALNQGAGVEKNQAQAAEWFRKGAELGDADCMLQYGYMLSHGHGVALDTNKAFEMYLRAARAGSTDAMFNIGEYYKSGKSVTQNASAARFWYLRAAMGGDTDAEKKLAELIDAPATSAEGAAMYEQAERTRNSAKTDAEFRASKAKALPLMVQAAELGHLPAVAMLVYAYQNGDGTEKDPVKAREWAQIAAEMGNDAAQNMLAQYMLKAVGGPRNTQGARFWFEKSALAGNSLAMSFLAQIYDGDYGLPPNEALATYWWTEAYKKGSPTAEKVLKERGLIEPDPVAKAFIDRIHRDGPDTTSVQTYTFDVAQYCKYDGPRCHELSVAALKFQRSQNAAAESANMARLWNVSSSNDPNADAKWRERSDCMKKKTESIRKHTYGQQDWYYSGACY